MNDIYIFTAMGAVFAVIGFWYSVPAARKALRQGNFDEEALRRYASNKDPLMFYLYIGIYFLFPFFGLLFFAVGIWSITQ